MKRFSTTAFAGLLLAAGLVVQGHASTELRWLADAPVRYFNDRDWDLAKAAINSALDTAADGETVTWSNPDTGNHGSVMPVSTMQKDDTTCRMAKIANHANKLDGGGTFEFCRKPDGTWAANLPPRNP